jgi:hypothetical protein
VNPDYRPVFFYVKAPLNYAAEITKLPANTHYFLVRTEKRAGGANYAKMGAKVGASTRPHKGFAQRRDGPLRGRSASKGPLTAFQNGIG